MPKPLVKRDWEWRSPSRIAAIPKGRAAEMRRLLLAVDDSQLIDFIRKTAGVKIRKQDIHIKRGQLLDILASKEARS